MKITTVDAFTNQPFSGNPAAVCITDKPLETGFMQQLANEINLSETAFLYPVEKGYHLRWFTPTAEIKLCGHATLASAHILWEEKRINHDQPAIFHTLSGQLIAEKRGEFIELDFPAILTQPKTIDSYIKDAIKEEIKASVYNDGGYWIIEVADEQVVRGLKPDLNLVAKTNSVFIVTGKSNNSRYDFVSRVFVPSYGIDEDPVTGSAHCALTTYWSQKLNKKELTAFQASKRGGELKLRLEGDRVKLIGQAVTIFTGNFQFNAS